ncbi:MAG: PhzF family phenazine biosynthesis protein [Cyanobacteria bacterium P01_F01_bin.42]
MAKPLSVYWVNAFTAERFTGNPAVVVPEASGLSDRQMQQIAREMNCSETAFILTPADANANFRLRWFTPTQEVPLCGHATVAALHVLAETGQYDIAPEGMQTLQVETLTGVLAVTVDFESGGPWIWLTLPKCAFEPLAADALSSIQMALFAEMDEIGASIISAAVDSLNRDVLLQVDSLATLQSLTPDSKALKRLGTDSQWRGFSVFTTETLAPEPHAQSRFFAPQSGIIEDPVTGSASGPLALYLKQQGLVTANYLIFEQGHCLDRPGQIHVDLSTTTPRCGGQAVTVLTGVLND